MNNGLIIPTWVLAENYKEVKGLKESTRTESASLLEVLICIDGRGYILENSGHEIKKIVDSLKNIQRNDQLTDNQKWRRRLDLIMRQ